MLEKIRNMNLGWIIILIGLVVIISGIEMKEGGVGEKTFLCFDEECIYVQGVSNIVVGLLSVGVGAYMVLKKIKLSP